MRVFKEVVRKGELDLGEVAAGAGGGGGAGGNNGADERVLAVVRGLGPVLLGVLGNEVSRCVDFPSEGAISRDESAFDLKLTFSLSFPLFASTRPTPPRLEAQA